MNGQTDRTFVAVCEDSACEPSTIDRVFKTPACEAFDKANDGSRYNTSIDVYEVCPSIRGAWQVVLATHKSK